MKSQKIKSQNLHVLIFETNRKNLHPQKKPVIRYSSRNLEIIAVFSTLLVC